MKVCVDFDTGDDELDSEIRDWFKRYSSRLEEFEDREETIPDLVWMAVHYAAMDDDFRDYFEWYLEGYSEHFMKEI